MGQFSADQPAASIEDVIDYLKGDFQSGDLFRGQTKDYPALVPSTYRVGVLRPTEDEPLIAMNEDRVFADWNRHKKLRWAVLNGLIGEVGIGFGNLIAQQYGLTSECIDVTEDPAIAGFFATRKWPEYRHYPGPGIGVLYRWRGLGEGFQPNGFTLPALDGWFQMGRMDNQYFDSFVRDGAWIGTFDRDHWFNWETGTTSVVSTLPLVMRWTEILGLVLRERGGNPLLTKSRSQLTRDNVLRADWRVSRIAGQKGGFIRPAMYWNSSVPSRSQVAHSHTEMQRIYSRGTIGPQFGESQPHDDLLPWPRIVPSLAIKRTFVGMDNMRLHPTCERFYFQHSETMVAGLYRRELWPEPAEDPVYSLLWDYALIWLMSANVDEPDMPAVDDLEGGLLDRGYRGKREARTRDARNLDEVAGLMLEDAAEHLLSPKCTGLDASRASVALMQLGQHKWAMKAAIDGVRRFPKSLDAVLSLSSTLNRAGKRVWARRALHAAEAIDPLHPLVLHGLALVDMEHMRYTEAASRLDQALARFDPIAQRNLEEYFLSERAIVAGVLGEEKRFAEVCDRLRDLAVDDPEGLVAEQIRQRRAALQRRDRISRFRPEDAPGASGSGREE